MTIDKTIEFFNGLECHTPQAKDARDVAVNTMRKYQKIEELAEYHMLRFLPKECMSSFQKDILEVLEDGNDD